MLTSFAHLYKDFPFLHYGSRKNRGTFPFFYSKRFSSNCCLVNKSLSAQNRSVNRNNITSTHCKHVTLFNHAQGNCFFRRLSILILAKQLNLIILRNQPVCQITVRFFLGKFFYCVTNVQKKINVRCSLKIMGKQSHRNCTCIKNLGMENMAFCKVLNSIQNSWA